MGRKRGRWFERDPILGNRNQLGMIDDEAGTLRKGWLGITKLDGNVNSSAGKILRLGRNMTGS